MVSHISRDGVLIDVTRVPPYLTWQSYKKYSITQAFRDFFCLYKENFATINARNFYIEISQFFYSIHDKSDNYDNHDRYFLHRTISGISTILLIFIYNINII